MSNRKPKLLSKGNKDCDSTQHTVLMEKPSFVGDPKEHATAFTNCSILLCARCCTVVADSLGVCGEVKKIKSVICLKVTVDVKVKGKFELFKDGVLAFCTYQVLECNGCRRSVGVVLHSTPPHLSSLRNLFLLRKDALNCYVLNCGDVKASKVSFALRPLGRNITELQQDLVAQLKQVDILKKRLEELSIPRVAKPNAKSVPH